MVATKMSYRGCFNIWHLAHLQEMQSVSQKLNVAIPQPVSKPFHERVHKVEHVTAVDQQVIRYPMRYRQCL